MKKLLEIILTPFRLLKNLFVLLWSRKLTRAFIILSIVVLGIHMYRTLSPHWSKKDNEVPTSIEASTEMTTTEATTGVPSTEDISSIVSEMVESQVAEKLAEMNSTPAVTQVPETTVATTVKTVTADVEESLIEDSITFYHGENSDLYSVSCMFSMSSAYEAALYSTFCSGNGRNVTIEIPENVTSISVAVSFRSSDNNLSELSEYEELVLEQTENGLEAQYSIPDLPEGKYDINCPKFYGVFRLNTTDGFEYFSISY